MNIKSPPFDLMAVGHQERRLDIHLVMGVIVKVWISKFRREASHCCGLLAITARNVA